MVEQQVNENLTRVNENLSRGTYFIKIISKKDVVLKKLIVQ